MRKASGTHRGTGKKGGVSAGLESGVTETMKVGNTNPEETGAQRPKPQKHGSIATGKSK